MSFIMYCVVEFKIDRYLIYVLTLTVAMTILTLYATNLLKFPDESEQPDKFDNEK